MIHVEADELEVIPDEDQIQALLDAEREPQNEEVVVRNGHAIRMRESPDEPVPDPNAPFIVNDDDEEGGLLVLNARNLFAGSILAVLFAFGFMKMYEMLTRPSRN